MPTATARAENTTHKGDTQQPAARRDHGGGPLERVTVNLIPRAARALQQAASITGDTRTDTINRAVQVLAFLEEVSANGGAVYVRESGDGELQRLKMF